jgi:hypothetical protein
MRLTRMVWLAGVLLVPVLLVTGCGDSAAKRSSMDNNIHNAKMILADLKKTFASGQTIDSTNLRGGEKDNRMGIVALLIVDKLPYMVNKRVTDATKRAAIQAKLKETCDFVEKTLVPKYVEADASKKPEDAKALVPLADQLDKQLDEINKLLP